MFGKRGIVGYGDKEGWYIKEVTYKLASDLIIKNHYSHKVYIQATTYINLGLYLKSELMGVLQFGYAMNPASCDSVVSGTAMNQYLELNRMWLCDEAGANSESRAISYSIKYIKNRYPKIKWIQSFADERCGMFGIVYQAANFGFYGEHLSEFWELDNIQYHNSQMTNTTDNNRNALYLRANKDRAKKMKLRQFRYLYFIDQSWKAKCLLKEKPYPKYYAE